MPQMYGQFLGCHGHFFHVFKCFFFNKLSSNIFLCT